MAYLAPDSIGGQAYLAPDEPPAVGAIATPAGVTATASVGTVTATGGAVATPSGVSAFASVGIATASGGASGAATAQPAGVSAVASVGTVTATGGAAAYPAGVTATASVGQVIATGTIIGPGALTPNATQFYTGRTRQRLYTGGQSMNFSPKRSTETEIFAVDFAPLLAVSETIQSAAWTSTVVDGIDPTPNATISGVATISGTNVSNKITAGIPGLRYAPICTAQTSLGQTLVLPEYGHGLLLVTL